MATAIPGENRDIAANKNQPALIELAPGSVRYRVAGDFTRAGKPAEAPLVTIRITQPLAIMKHQVSSADYQRCVAENACRALPPDVTVAADRPAAMVSWRDADAYAAWLSRKTGEVYRLPTDEEWAYAAGSRYQDDSAELDGELRRARGRRSAQGLCDGLHPRCSRRRLRGWRCAEQSRIPPGAGAQSG